MHTNLYVKSYKATVVREKTYQSLQAWKKKKKFLIKEACDAKNKIFFFNKCHVSALKKKQTNYKTNPLSKQENIMLCKALSSTSCKKK